MSLWGDLATEKLLVRTQDAGLDSLAQTPAATRSLISSWQKDILHLPMAEPLSTRLLGAWPENSLSIPTEQKAKELKELVDHLLWHVSLYSRDRDSTKVVDASIAVTAARAGDV